MFLLLITIDSEFTIQFPFQNDFYFVKLLEFLDDMICMLISKILDSRVINNEVEGCGSVFVVP